jgi:hypothetical protein
MAAVVFTVEAVTALKHVGVSSEFIAAGAARNNDVLIPFGSFDPLTGAALEELGFPAISHNGQTGIGSGLAGGFGVRLRLSNPHAARRRRCCLPFLADRARAPRFPGKRKVSQSPPTRQTFGWTSPDGAPSTSHPR